METRKCSWNGAARAAAAAAIASVPISSAQAQTPIETDNLGTYTAGDLDSGGVEFDLDGDGLNDFAFESFYGYDLLISPLSDADPPAAVLIDGSGDVTRFMSAEDVFAAAQSSDSTESQRTISNPFTDPISSFLDPGYFGLLFEIPGGSPYIAAIQIDVDVDSVGDLVQVQILGGSYQAVPAPGATALAALAMTAGLRRRR